MPFFERFRRRFSVHPGVVVEICSALHSPYPAGEGSASRRHKFPRLQAIRLSHSRTSLARKRPQLRRVATPRHRDCLLAASYLLLRRRALWLRLWLAAFDGAAGRLPGIEAATQVAHRFQAHAL
jgi:hypothetical protein